MSTEPQLEKSRLLTLPLGNHVARIKYRDEEGTATLVLADAVTVFGSLLGFHQIAQSMNDGWCHEDVEGLTFVPQSDVIFMDTSRKAPA